MYLLSLCVLVTYCRTTAHIAASKELLLKTTCDLPMTSVFRTSFLPPDVKKQSVLVHLSSVTPLCLLNRQISFTVLSLLQKSCDRRSQTRFLSPSTSCQTLGYCASDILTCRSLQRKWFKKDMMSLRLLSAPTCSPTVWSVRICSPLIHSVFPDICSSFYVRRSLLFHAPARHLRLQSCSDCYISHLFFLPFASLDVSVFQISLLRLSCCAFPSPSVQVRADFDVKTILIVML